MEHLLSLDFINNFIGSLTVSVIIDSSWKQISSFPLSGSQVKRIGIHQILTQGQGIFLIMDRWERVLREISKINENVNLVPEVNSLLGTTKIFIVLLQLRRVEIIVLVIFLFLVEGRVSRCKVGNIESKVSVKKIVGDVLDSVNREEITRSGWVRLHDYLLDLVSWTGDYGSVVEVLGSTDKLPVFRMLLLCMVWESSV